MMSLKTVMARLKNVLFPDRRFASVDEVFQTVAQQRKEEDALREERRGEGDATIPCDDRKD
jgi:hypothetical protein